MIIMKDIMTKISLVSYGLGNLAVILGIIGSGNDYNVDSDRVYQSGRSGIEAKCETFDSINGELVAGGFSLIGLGLVGVGISGTAQDDEDNFYSL